MRGLILGQLFCFCRKLLTSFTRSIYYATFKNYFSSSFNLRSYQSSFNQLHFFPNTFVLFFFFNPVVYVRPEGPLILYHGSVPQFCHHSSRCASHKCNLRVKFFKQAFRPLITTIYKITTNGDSKENLKGCYRIDFKRSFYIGSFLGFLFDN